MENKKGVIMFLFKHRKIVGSITAAIVFAVLAALLPFGMVAAEERQQYDIVDMRAGNADAERLSNADGAIVDNEYFDNNLGSISGYIDNGGKVLVTDGRANNSFGEVIYSKGGEYASDPLIAYGENSDFALDKDNVDYNKVMTDYMSTSNSDNINGDIVDFSYMKAVFYAYANMNFNNNDSNYIATISLRLRHEYYGKINNINCYNVIYEATVIPLNNFYSIESFCLASMESSLLYEKAYSDNSQSKTETITQTVTLSPNAELRDDEKNRWSLALNASYSFQHSISVKDGSVFFREFLTYNGDYSTNKNFNGEYTLVDKKIEPNNHKYEYTYTGMIAKTFLVNDTNQKLTVGMRFSRLNVIGIGFSPNFETDNNDAVELFCSWYIPYDQVNYKVEYATLGNIDQSQKDQSKNDYYGGLNSTSNLRKISTNNYGN